MAAGNEVTAAELGDDPQALVNLLERIPHEEWRPRRSAVMGLRRLALEGHDMRPLNRRTDDRNKLAEVTPAEALGVLAAIAVDAGEHENVRLHAALALGEHGDQTVLPALAAMLRDPSKHLRRRAAKAMRDLGVAAAESDLLIALGDPEKDVRAAAARALGVVGGERSVQPLAQRAAIDDKVYVRQEALAALRAIGNGEGLRAVDDVLAKASSLTRWRLQRWIDREATIR